MKFSREEGTVAMIKYDQSFHQRQIFIKMEEPLLIILRMAYSNQPHTDKLWFMVLIVDDHIRMFLTEPNDYYYPPSVLELEDN